MLPWLNHIAYAALLYLVARWCNRGDGARVVGVGDVLALNWALGILAFAAVGAVSLPVHIALDALTGFWLLSRPAGVTRWLVGVLHIPPIIANAGLYIGHDVMGLTGISLNVWSWLQMATLIWGAWGDGLGQVVDRASGRLGRRRFIVAGLSRVAGEEKGQA